MKNIKYIIENTVWGQVWKKLEIGSLNKINFKLWQHMETQTHVIKSHTYRITNDYGYISTYYKLYFRLLSELRDERIDEILND
jgi:hypothetical protein